MAEKKRNTDYWTGMRSLVPASLKKISPNRDNILEWVSLQWAVTVGEEIARISKVEKMGPKTLYVFVAGNEWLPVLKELEKKIVGQLNENCSQNKFTRIIFKTGNIPVERPASTLPSGKGKIAKPPPNNIRPQKSNLDMIKDPDLRKTLERLSHKFRFTALALSCLFLSNCAAIKAINEGPASELPAKVELSESYTVKKIQELNQQKPDSELRDPRAYYHYLIAMRAERQRDFREAANQYAIAAENDPKNEEFHTKQILFLQRSDQFERVISQAEKALERFPLNVDIRMILADVLFSMNEKQKALDHYNRITEIDPGNARAYLLAGYAQDSMNQLEKAKESFEKVTLSEPANPFGFYYLAKNLAKRGQVDAAIEMFKKALTLKPSFLQAREHLAWYLEDKKRYIEAVQQYQVILKLNPSREKIKEYLDQVKASGEENTEVNASLFEQVSPPPFRDPDIHQLFGIHYYEKTAYLNCIDEFRLVLKQKEDIGLRLALSKIFELYGQLEEAIRGIEEFRQRTTEPVSVEVLLSLARLYGLNDQLEKAIVLIRQAIKIDPEKDSLYHSLALAYMSTNKNELAIVNIKKAIAINKENGAYHFELGALFERVGSYDDAIKSMKQTLALNPDHSNAHNFIGYMYSVHGENLDKALEHLEKALAIQPKNGYFLDSLGWIYFKKGDSKRALTEIKRAMVYTSPDPVLYDHLGDVYFSLKNYTEARRAWRTSLSLTVEKSDDYVGEVPDEVKLREKIRNVNEALRQSY